MSGFIQSVVAILPHRLQSAVRERWRRVFRLQGRVREWWIPFGVWSLWLIFQCARHQKKAVVVCRFGGIGDVICALPMCDEVRQRHPGRLVIFVTAAIWREVVAMSRSIDLVYANRSWTHPLTIPTNVTLFGLVRAIYNPRTTGERLSHSFGTTAHLVDDLAASCGFAVTSRQPRLRPSGDLIEQTRITFKFDRKTMGERLLIGIDPGPSWPVREWQPLKWQALINKIHSEYDALIIQFGTNKGDGSSEYDNLNGVKSLAGQLNGEKFVALLASCDLVISIDSGPLHVAGAVGTPVIGLFGPLDPLSRLPVESASLGLFGDVPCLFCNNRTPVLHWVSGCPNDIACMKKLDDERVFQAVKSMLARSEKRRVGHPPFPNKCNAVSL